MRTKSGLPKGCSYIRDRHGKTRIRFRTRGFSCYLPLGEGFQRAYAAVIAGKPRAEIGSTRTIAGTVNALIISYYASSAFQDLRPSTQRLRRNILESFRADHGDKRLQGLSWQHLDAIIAAKKKPETRNHLLKALRAVLDVAVLQGLLPNNPAKLVKRAKSKNPDGYHSWTEEEVLQFEARHPIGTKARLALALGMFTGQRKGDCLKMGWQHISDGGIRVKQEKTGTELLIPVHPELKKILDITPREHLTLIVTEFGAQFTAGGFGNWFKRRCREAGLPHCPFHGLRKLAATRIIDAGGTSAQAMAITGHKDLRVFEKYIRGRDQKRLAREALTQQLRRAKQ
jgi:integrase